jgi:hypothetical protein
MHKIDMTGLFKAILLTLLAAASAFNSLAQKAEAKQNWKIDSVHIYKNWRTRDKIIMHELQFKTGETVDREHLARSIEQIWNIGNFAEVSYTLDSISPDGYLLRLTARDAFNFVPNISINGNKYDKNLSLGFDDKNFLGRNIRLGLSGNFGTFRNSYNVDIRIPRQLLYKNMFLAFSASSGSGSNYRYENNQKIQAVAYHSKQFSGAIGNPEHTDYYYTFSPDFAWCLFQHKTDPSLLETTVPFAPNYSVSYLDLAVRESVGRINSYRHLNYGSLLWAGYDIGLGLNSQSKIYHSFSLGAQYNKIVSRFIELSASFVTGYTSSRLPSLIHYMNAGDVKGCITGQESGQGHYNIKLNSRFTYIYTNWFALEQSVYNHLGMAGDHYLNIFKKKPLASTGTKIRIWTPMVPWLAVSVYFTYLKGNDNWFQLEI